MQHRLQFADFLRIFFGKVSLFTDVIAEVEELNRTVIEVFDQFEITASNRSSWGLHAVIAVVRKVPVDRISIEAFLSF